MGRLTRLIVWMLNWRTSTAMAAVALVGLLAFIIVDASVGRRQAFTALERTTEQGLDIRRAQSRQIRDLERQVAAGNVRIGELIAMVAALQAQVRDLGAEPVVGPRGEPGRDAQEPIRPSPPEGDPPEEPEPPCGGCEPPPEPPEDCFLPAPLPCVPPPGRGRPDR